jgi:hypothetical protein
LQLVAREIKRRKSKKRAFEDAEAPARVIAAIRARIPIRGIEVSS